MIAHLTESITIRRLCVLLDDAAALASVEHDSLGDSAYTPAEMLAVLARPEHHAYLAYDGAQPVGFVSCFETDGALDVGAKRTGSQLCPDTDPLPRPLRPYPQPCRLEVDMLGVLPAWRGRGIATQLITHALGQAAARGVRSARSVVASGNVASQRAFERAGFRALASPGGAASSLVHAMLVYAIGGLCPQPLPPGWEVRLTANDACEHLELDHQSQLVGAAECLRVQTLCYSGLWVERLAATSDRALGWLARAVVERAKSLDLHEVGYLAPQAEPRATDARAPRCLPLVREGYADRGDYYVYTAVWP